MEENRKPGGTTKLETKEDLPPPRRKRGFALMDPKLVSEISRRGGKAAHAEGKAHVFTSDEAREAGRKGGKATHAKRAQQQVKVNDDGEE